MMETRILLTPVFLESLDLHVASPRKEQPLHLADYNPLKVFTRILTVETSTDSESTPLGA
jgi:hypothetical protein